MNFKYPFFFLAGVIVMAGIAPFALSQVGQTEPSMEIDMLAGQTQYPFRIQDDTDTNVFAVKPNGGLDPVPTMTTIRAPITNAYFDELYPQWAIDSTQFLVTQTAETGAGIYQWQHTITADDVDPVDSMLGIFKKKDFRPFLTAQLENLSAGTISSHYKLFVNNVEIASGNDPSHSAGNFIDLWHYEEDNYWNDIAGWDFIEEGDVIGIKFWTDTPSQLRINKIALVGIPDYEVEALSFSLGDHSTVRHPNNWQSDFPSEFAPTTPQWWQSGCWYEEWQHSNVWCYGEGAFQAVRGVTLINHFGDSGSFNDQVGDTIIWLRNDDIQESTEGITYTIWK